MDEIQRTARECGSCFQRCGDNLDDEYKHKPSSFLLSDIGSVIEKTSRYLMFLTAIVTKLQEYIN